MTDINPCIFNVLVKVYEKLIELGLPGDCAVCASLEESYQMERDLGFAHYVDGGVRMHPSYAGTVVELMQSMYAEAVTVRAGSPARRVQLLRQPGEPRCGAPPDR